MKTFERPAADRRSLLAIAFALALLPAGTRVVAAGGQDDSLGALRTWVESENLKWPRVEALRFDPVTSSNQAAVEDGNHLIGICCLRLPRVADPAQKPAVEAAYKEQSRLVATVEAMTLIARPVVQQWKIEQGEFSDKLAAFVVQKKLLATLPPDVTVHVGVSDGRACAYIRIPKPAGTAKTLLDGLDKDSMLGDFSTWVAEQGIAAVSRKSYRQALSMFALARKADAHNTAYLSYALRCFAGLDRMEDFNAIVRTLLRDSRYPARLYLECGRVCHEQEKLEEAIQLYAQIPDGSPERPAADAAMVSAYVAIQQRSLLSIPATAPTTATTQPASAPEGAP